MEQLNKITAILLYTTTLLIAGDNDMHNNLDQYISERQQHFSNIPDDRKEQLGEFSNWIMQKLNNDEIAQLVFICTHNSRRSHMAQIWAQTAAFYYRLPGVECYSGGTETTAFNPRAVRAMINAGFEVTSDEDGDNPEYTILYSNEADTIKAWSKTYDDPANPQSEFAAVMTCSAADEACPVVPGADARFAITYEDPKNYDDTPLEKEKYDERCAQIATEMLYVFHKIGGAI